MLKLTFAIAIATTTTFFVSLPQAWTLELLMQVAKKSTALPTKASMPVNPEATALLDALRETHSMLKVGFNARDYADQARKLQVRLDRFLTSKGAESYPGGFLLKTTAESYIRGVKLFPGYYPGLGSEFDRANEELLQMEWKAAASSLQFFEECYRSGAKGCTTLKQGRDVQESHQPEGTK